MNWAIELSEQHNPRDGDADIFGVILYTDRNPHVKKLLNDDDYWAALDDWSGPSWAVFATRAAPGSMELPAPPSGAFAYMVPVWKEPKANKDLLRTFELENTKDLPALVIFAKADDGEVLRRFESIQDESVEDVARSLRVSMSNVASALDQVEENNKRNTLGVFAAVSLTLEHEANWRRLKKGVQIWQWLKSVS